MVTMKKSDDNDNIIYSVGNRLFLPSCVKSVVLNQGFIERKERRYSMKYVYTYLRFFLYLEAAKFLSKNLDLELIYM